MILGKDHPQGLGLAKSSWGTAKLVANFCWPQWEFPQGPCFFWAALLSYRCTWVEQPVGAFASNPAQETDPPQSRASDSAGRAVSRLRGPVGRGRTLLSQKRPRQHRDAGLQICEKAAFHACRDLLTRQRRATRFCGRIRPGALTWLVCI